ncbi:glutamate--tRNA ligase, partial [bacterium]|nr:glutamate--tRNA ligase [bacterium]
HKKGTPELALAALQGAAEALGALESWTPEAMETACRALCETNEWKIGTVFMALRVATTGRKASPPLFETMEVIGRDRSLARIAKAIGGLEGS